MEEKIVQPTDYPRLMKMHDNYKNDTHRHNSQRKRKKETRSIWFENNHHLQKFFNDIMNPGNNVSGVRVYLCEYDETTLPAGLDPALKPNYLHKLTVGFVTTKFDAGSNRHKDDPGKSGAKLLNVDAFNHGKLCPPDICNTEEEEIP